MRRLAWGRVLKRFQLWALIKQQPQGGTTMVLAHGGLEIGGGQMLGMGLMGAPLHEEAVANSAEQAGYEHGRRVADAAPVVVVRNIQSLVQAIFDATETGAVEFEPLLRVQSVRFRTG